MSTRWVVSTETERLVLDEQRQGVTTLTVTNTSAATDRAQVGIVTDDTAAGWFTLDEPIRLVGAPDAPRLLGVTSGTDHTDRMTAFATRRAQELVRRGLSGYVLKRGSPSCGMARVKLYRDEGVSIAQNTDPETSDIFFEPGRD